MVIFGNEKAMPEYVKSKTVVWWDMDTCPVPDGYDPHQVCPSIECALRNLGYYGPVTITAVGNLEKTPAHVLQGLSSTGISVKHSIPDKVGVYIFADLMIFKLRNPPPATMMLISDKVEAEFSIPLCVDQQARTGYNLVLAYTKPFSKRSVLHTTAEWLWKTILAANKQETRTYVLHKCSDSGESASFWCRTCDFTCLSVADFTRHLSSKEHKQREINLIKSRVRDTGDGDELSKVETLPKSKRLRKAFRTNHVLLLTKRRSRRRARES